MSSALLTKYNSLEKERQLLFTELNKKSAEELNFKPHPSSWSIIQAVHHVMNAEKLAVDYMSKKIKGINSSPKTGLSAKLRFFLLKLALQTSIKFKAPKVLADPPANEPLQNIISQWNESRQKLKGLLENFPPEHENKEVFKNLVAGKLNIHQALGWMDDHFSHHLVQIERISASYKSNEK